MQICILTSKGKASKSALGNSKTLAERRAHTRAGIGCGGGSRRTSWGLPQSKGGLVNV